MNYMVISPKNWLWYTLSIDHMVLWDIAESRGFSEPLFMKTKHSSQPHPQFWDIE